MWTNLLLVFVLIQGSFCAENELKLTPFLPACYRDDHNFNNCLLNSTELLRPFLKEGIPELALPSISQYIIPQIKFGQSDSNANYVSFWEDTIVTGLDTYNFTSVKFDADELILAASFKISHLNFKGTHHTNGHALGVSVEGDGTFSVNFTNSDFFIKQLLGLTTRDGVTFLELLTDLTKIDLGTISYVYDGLHKDDPWLARKADRAIDEYEPQWMGHMKTIIEQKLVEIITNALLKNLYKAVPYDKLFPTRK